MIIAPAAAAAAILQASSSTAGAAAAAASQQSDSGSPAAAGLPEAEPPLAALQQVERLVQALAQPGEAQKPNIVTLHNKKTDHKL